MTEEIFKELKETMRKMNDLSAKEIPEKKELREMIQRMSGLIVMLEPEVNIQNKEEEKAQRIEFLATKYLMQLRVPAKLKGYRYLKTAIVLAITNPKLLDSITQKLYKEVAKGYESNASRVEKSIRKAINDAWLEGNLREFERLFGNSKENPTNAFFIATLVERIQWEILRKK